MSLQIAEKARGGGCEVRRQSTVIERSSHLRQLRTRLTVTLYLLWAYVIDEMITLWFPVFQKQTLHHVTFTECQEVCGTNKEAGAQQSGRRFKYNVWLFISYDTMFFNIIALMLVGPITYSFMEP